MSLADADDVLGRPPEIDHVEIDIRERPFQRIERMGRIILGAEQPLFFGGDGEE